MEMRHQYFISNISIASAQRHIRGFSANRYSYSIYCSVSKSAIRFPNRVIPGLHFFASSFYSSVVGSDCIQRVTATPGNRYPIQESSPGSIRIKILTFVSIQDKFLDWLELAARPVALKLPLCVCKPYASLDIHFWTLYWIPRNPPVKVPDQPRWPKAVVISRKPP